ncbi:MAG TPA: type II toxin-antitoxin system VapC family toxin [Acidimicrobiales bacterium]
MKLYFDSSAIVKVIQLETESPSLFEFLELHSEDQVVTSALARVEVARSLYGADQNCFALMKRHFSRMMTIAIDAEILERAASMLPGARLRSLDAIHLASAMAVGDGLRSVVTYDARMLDAARVVGLRVSSPAP